MVAAEEDARLIKRQIGLLQGQRGGVEETNKPRRVERELFISAVRRFLCGEEDCHPTLVESPYAILCDKRHDAGLVGHRTLKGARERRPGLLEVLLLSSFFSGFVSAKVVGSAAANCQPCRPLWHRGNLPYGYLEGESALARTANRLCADASESQLAFEAVAGEDAVVPFSGIQRFAEEFGVSKVAPSRRQLSTLQSRARHCAASCAPAVRRKHAVS
eukprot:GHVU01216125.1.p1 GENE.GHVU01216125.1~~GHVU01216125.1.p1  ORF type:complete len:217 (+),score=28.35 GHVU01216125.1:521-1171(+)